MSAARRDLDALSAAIAAAEAERGELRAVLAVRAAALPLRYWRQQAHLTTPAADPGMARKAVEGGTSATARILERLGLRPEDLADCLELPVALIEGRLAVPTRAPLVMLDGEDAIAPTDDAAVRGIEVAAETLTTADWGRGAGSSLRFYRPAGLGVERSLRDLLTLLWRLRSHAPDGERLPLDGLVFPKIEQPEEVDLVHRQLDRAEHELGLQPGAIRVAYLVESGWAAAQLAEIARRAAPRLSALIFGIADFSADLGLPEIGNSHGLVAWARAEIVAVAGAVGVPAIDGMTLDYPVVDAGLDPAANRSRWLQRMRLAYDDATHARELGMAGKWVGHPAQLFAVMLAYEAGMTDATLEREAAKLRAYADATAADQGATIIDGVMSDRATDRHARVLLRQATASGRFDPARAEALGVISADERPEADQAFHRSDGGGR